MDFFLNELGAFLVGGLLTLLITSGRQFWIKQRYKKWTVRLIHNGETLVERPISPRKALQIKEEPSDLAVYAKGIASPYGWVKCDMLAMPQMIVRDEQNKEIVIDLNKDVNFVRNEFT